jgi:protein-histidine pros-kinase
MQIDNSSTRRYEGAGLGLHLSQKIAEMLGGVITVESELGKGSRFTLTLRDAYP